MTHDTVFYLTEAELDDLDLSRFHAECNPIRHRNCTDFIARLGQIEVHSAGLVALPPDELVVNTAFRNYVRLLVHEWPSYWLFLRLDPPYLLYHLAAQSQHVIITSNDRDGSYCFSIPTDEIVALLLTQYPAAVAEAATCGAPWAVAIGRLWDVFKSLSIRMFALCEHEVAKEHPMPYVHSVTGEEIRNADVTKLKVLFTAATIDSHTAGIMRGSIGLCCTEPTEQFDSFTLGNWAKKLLAELPECIFLLTLDDHGLVGLLKYTVSINPNTERLEIVDLFHILMGCYPTLVKMEMLAGSSESQAIERLRAVLRQVGYAFCV